MNLAIKDIKHNFYRFLFTALGIGMLLMVVMGMHGIYRGIVEDATLLVDKLNSDVWIVQNGTRGPFAEISQIPENIVDRALTIPGVESSRQFLQHTVQREYNDKQLRFSIVGLDYPTDKGHWINLVSGRYFTQAHYEMIADKSLGLKVGEKIKLGNDLFTVVGLTSNMISSAGDGLAFMTISDAINIQNFKSGETVRLSNNSRSINLSRSNIGNKQPALVEYSSRSGSNLPGTSRKQVNAVLLKLKPGANIDKVVKTINGWKDVTAYTADQQKNLLLTGSVEKVKQQIGLFSALLTIISGIIMALILYTLTLDKLHSIALMKLIGATNWSILKLILTQALILGGAGYTIAYLFGQKIFPMFPRRVIQTQGDLIQLGIIVLFISILSSCLGVVKALKVNPNDALN